MIKQNITIINKLGLHARAASKLVNCASQFESEVFIGRNGNQVNAKSIMGVMMLAASKGVELELEVDGGDEQACHQALVELIGNRFGEDE
ncbi:MAG: HPr family phosphocarrier protein [Gammaproteobacteria bacterium]|nr:HPr family phosphocarrier protein [Gammaproteobacteria bacterium]